MPADGFAFAVRVSCQIDKVAGFGSGLDLFDQLAFAGDSEVARAEILLDVHADIFGGQVTDVTHTGNDLVAVTQIFADGFGLGRAFHDD